MEKELICGACNMVFRSTGLLEKHKALFCIGSEVRHFQVRSHSSEILIRGNAADVHPKQTRTPDLVQLRGQHRNITSWRSFDTDPKSGKAKESAALQNLTEEFHKLRMSVEEILPDWSKRSTNTEACGRQLGHTERLKEMREMAALHEHQLALIHAQNQQLEQQKEEIALGLCCVYCVSELALQVSVLMELREQEERNKETLQQLAEQLHTLHVKEVPVPADQPAPCENKKMHHDDNYELISSVDGPLSAQIKALRQAYIQSGGSDPTIVAQMINLQKEAQSLERNQPATATETSKKEKVKHHLRDPSQELLAVEQENQRLEEEILMIQLARRKCHNYEAVRTEHELIQTETLQQIVALQAEMERNKERQPPRPPAALQPKSHTHVPFSLLEVRSFTSPSGRCMLDPLDSLGPAPYDPGAGFVVFYDLVLGVDASHKALRLLAALYSEGQEVGRTTPLPPVQCLPGVSLPYTHSLQPGNYALLSVKQPVPRIQPSLSLSLVVEVQTATDLDPSNQEIFKLLSCGWTQLELFDQHNQLCSGHWRAPVRRLPIRPSLNHAQINSIPQVDNMELCVRLVNGRDGGVQTMAMPDPCNTSHYKYPAVVSTLPVTIPVSPPQSSGVDQLSSPLPFTEHQDPPPPEETSQS
ncbi:coiled-coil domain-containing protein 17 [Scomber japonicus]|uniref:coiled-coil domain-containing protein 17 n=1 Tax=Scomber japonicus TaxID=13676 RepID=UPI002304F4F4|nr:coiled-coil domain-containing protein 17 [Scomber japonicus]